MSSGPDIHRYESKLISNLYDFDASEVVDEMRGWASEIVGEKGKVAMHIKADRNSSTLFRVLAPLFRYKLGKPDGKGKVRSRLFPYHIHNGLGKIIDKKEECTILDGKYNLHYENGSPQKFIDSPNFNVIDLLSESFRKEITNAKSFPSRKKIILDRYFEEARKHIQKVRAKFVADATTKAGIKSNVFKGVSERGNAYGVEKLEPFASLSRSQVLKLAKYLRVPHYVICRSSHPLLGSVLRMGGEFTRYKNRVVRYATDEAEQEIYRIYQKQRGNLIKEGKREEADVLDPYYGFTYTIDPKMKTHKKISFDGEKAYCYVTQTKALTGYPHIGVKKSEITDEIAWLESTGPLHKEVILGMREKLENQGFSRVVYQTHGPTQNMLSSPSSAITKYIHDLPSPERGTFYPVVIRITDSDDPLTANPVEDFFVEKGKGAVQYAEWPLRELTGNIIALQGYLLTPKVGYDISRNVPIEAFY